MKHYASCIQLIDIKPESPSCVWIICINVGVDVRLNTEATASELKKFHCVVLATGK